MADINKIEIVIDGRNFTVVGGEDEEYVRAIAYYVDKKIRDLSSKNELLSQTMSATLAALNIADELYKTKDQLKELENKAKDPLEKYDLINIELEESKEEIKELRKDNKKVKELLNVANADMENLTKSVESLEREKDLKEKQLIESKKQNKLLQDKNFQNQIELVEARKELSEYIRLLDKETSTFTKEGK